MTDPNETGQVKLNPEDDGHLDVSRAGFSHLKDAIRAPGLTVDPAEIDRSVADVRKRLAVFFYKQDIPCLWISFVGGTGTGKSTLFNAFCGISLSETGVERPKTGGPIAYTHESCQVEHGFPFPDVVMDRPGKAEAAPERSLGRPGHLTVFTHHRAGWSHLIILDTPDLDSVETENLASVEAFYLLSDVIVFVASQDKYADDVPYQFLLKISEDQIPCFLLVNKTHDITKGEILSPLQGQGTVFPENRVWLIGYQISRDEESISADPGFSSFVQALLGVVSPDRAKAFHRQEQARRARALSNKIERLSELIQRERHEAQRWLAELNHLFEDSCAELIKAEKRRFTAESRQHLQSEIRKLFQRYDPLSGPRKLIRQILSAPFQVIGISLGRRPNHRKSGLSRVRQKVDLTPVLGTIERFNRSVLETLSPQRKESAFSRMLHKPDMALTEAEIRAAMLKEHDKLDQWLEKKFNDLSRGLPRHKRWGIYSTSILWGTLILSFEIVVGGGFSGLDAVLDSVLAPFITKGSMELFAYREIKAVAKELAQEYQQALRSVVKRQKERYEKALLDFLTEAEDLETLRELRKRLQHFT